MKRKLSLTKLNLADIKETLGKEILSREELKRINGGGITGSGIGGACEIGKACWNEFMRSFGVCFPSTVGCQCKAYQIYSWSYDCEAWA